MNSKSSPVGLLPVSLNAMEPAANAATTDPATSLPPRDDVTL